MLRKSYRSRRIYRMSFTNYIVARLICTAFRYVDFPRPLTDDTRVAFHRSRLNLYIAYPT